MTITDLETALDAKRRAGISLYGSTARAARDRAFTDDERAAVQAILDDARIIQAEIARRRGGDLLVDLERLAPPPAPRPRSIGAQFVEAPEFEFFRRGGHRASGPWHSPAIDVEAAVVTSGGLTVGQVEPGRYPEVIPWMTVAGLFAQGTLSGNAVQYPVEDTYTAAAAVVAEGTAKPQSAFGVSLRTDPLTKIATWVPIGEALLDDVPGLQAYLDNRLYAETARALDNQIMNGDGTGANMLGLVPRIPALNTYARGQNDSNANAVLAAAMQIAKATNILPDGAVLTPGAYVSAVMEHNGADFGDADHWVAGQPPTYLWGLRIVPGAVTPGVKTIDGVVGAFRQGAQLFTHGGLGIEMTNSHLDYFAKNLLVIRAERRAALAVYLPNTFYTLTNLVVGTIGEG